MHISFSSLAAVLSTFGLIASALPGQEVMFTPVASGVVSPTDIQAAPDGRLFIVERAGRIRLLDAASGTFAAEPVLDLQGIVEAGSGETGLLGMALHPDFASNRQLYVNYTRRLQGQLQTVVARYVVPEGLQIDTATAPDVIFIQDQPFSNHNAGQLQFGPDGFLYLGLGDGGDAGDPGNRAQNPESLLGKMLRLDVNGDAFLDDDERDYAIPADNPFVNHPAVRDEIWALGLRNPWRYSFDAATGALFIADVGQGQIEEVNVQAAGVGGLNYGWSRFEGEQLYNDGIALTVGSETFPAWFYDHSLGSSITGGYVYRPRHWSAYAGNYFAGDFVSGRIWRLSDAEGNWASNLLTDTDFGITTFGVGGDQALYVADYFGGTIYRIDLPEPSLEITATDGGMQLVAETPVTMSAMVETSTDLVSWDPLWALAPGEERTEMIDVSGPRFYRMAISNSQP